MFKRDCLIWMSRGGDPKAGPRPRGATASLATWQVGGLAIQKMDRMQCAAVLARRGAVVSDPAGLSLILNLIHYFLDRPAALLRFFATQSL